MVNRGRAAGSPDFGMLLRHYRLAAELSQEVLAERARMSVNGVSALERGTFLNQPSNELWEWSSLDATEPRQLAYNVADAGDAMRQHYNGQCAPLTKMCGSVEALMLYRRGAKSRLRALSPGSLGRGQTGRSQTVTECVPAADFEV